MIVKSVHDILLGTFWDELNFKPSSVLYIMQYDFNFIPDVCMEEIAQRLLSKFGFSWHPVVVLYVVRFSRDSRENVEHLFVE